MTHALQHIPTKVSENYLALSNRRAQIAEDPAVLSRMSGTEGMVLSAGSFKAIASMALDEFEAIMVKTLKYIARDVGVTYWDDPVKMMDRFDSIMVFSARFYRDMSAEDIKVAFDLCLAGKLDEFLPKDRHGDPDMKHYNEFGKDYFAKVMKAYKALKLSTWSKANKLLPEPVNELSKEERSMYRSSFLNSIYEKFKMYKERDERPAFMVPFLVLKEFKRAGVIDGKIEVSEEDVSNGFIRMTQDKNISPYQKHADARKYEDGEIPKSVEVKAIRCAYENLIIKIFDQMIEDGLDIEDIIK